MHIDPRHFFYVGETSQNIIQQHVTTEIEYEVWDVIFEFCWDISSTSINVYKDTFKDELRKVLYV